MSINHTAVRRVDLKVCDTIQTQKVTEVGLESNYTAPRRNKAVKLTVSDAGGGPSCWHYYKTLGSTRLIIETQYPLNCRTSRID